MPARPLYRSRFFLLGVPGLVFLVWVWWDSGGHVSYASYERGSELRQVEVIRGSVVWTYALDLKPTGFPAMNPLRVGRAELSKVAGVAEGRHFDFNAAFERGPQEVEIIAFGIQRQLDVSRLALWVMVLGYVVVWLGAVMAWRWRKKRMVVRLTESVMGEEGAG